MVRTSRTRAFTLIETLVTIAILAILVGILLAAVQHARAAGAANSCRNNLRQLTLALQHYQDSHGGCPSGTRSRFRSLPFSSWNTHILPLIEQGGLWRSAEEAYKKNWNFASSDHDAVRTSVVSLFICPADGRIMTLAQPDNVPAAITNYLGVSGRSLEGGMLYHDSRVKFSDVGDGLSHTFLIGERPTSADEHFGWWYAGVGVNNSGNVDHYLAMNQFNVSFRAPTCPEGPYTFRAGRNDDMCSAFHFWSHHPAGANFALCDGSVRFFPYSTEAKLLDALATRAGGEVVNPSE